MKSSNGNDQSDYSKMDQQLKVPFMVSRPQTQMRDRVSLSGVGEVEEKASVSTMLRNSLKSKNVSVGVTPQN